MYSDRLLRLRPRTGSVRTYPHSAAKAFWHNHNIVSDRQGNVYFNQGSLFCRFTDREGVEILKNRGSGDQPSFGTRLWLDRSEVLWEGTRGVGIRKYDLSPNPFRATPYRDSFYADLRRELGIENPDDPTSPLHPQSELNSYQFRYTLDKRGYLWFNVGSSDIRQFDPQTKRLVDRSLPVTFRDRGTEGIPCPLATDPDERVWAAHDSLVWYFDDASARWLAFPHRIPRQRTSRVLMFTVDRQALWLATAERGLWRLDRQTGQLRQYAHQPGNPRSLSNDALLCLSGDPDDPNRLWIGTFSSGLCAFDKQTGYFRRFTVADGLPNNVIYSVIPDAQGYLWMGTNKGICRLDRSTFATTIYTQAHGLQANEFNRFHWLHLPDQKVIMGGLEGITSFYPAQVGTDTYDPPVELTQLFIGNQPADPSLTDSLPPQALRSLTLAHDQNFITAEFAALQYNRPNNNRYRYRLAGLEEEWKETARPVATYTNLPPGDYVLLMNASNTTGRWSTQMRRLVLTIRPPWWATWWAYGLYVLAVAGLLWWGSRLYLNRLRLRQTLALREERLALQEQTLTLQEREMNLQEQQAEQLRAVDAMKSDFFANVTHEFRTPLTLILGPTEQLHQELGDPGHQRRLSTISRNARQLLGLVNQLLDFSKVEAGALSVVEVRGNLRDFVGRTVNSFGDAAREKAIALGYQPGAVTGDYWFDAEKLERILYNLLANALAHTPADGRVNVRLAPQENDVEITVQDTGTGIPADQLPHIFDRYYQVEDESSAGTGTGLGLALVNELVNLQKGKISVTSEVGRGTSFVIELPYHPVRSDALKVQLTHQESNGQGFKEEGLEKKPDSPKPSNEKLPLILVVEDNDELANYVTENLATDYRVERAADGQQGWEMALVEWPDLILSDVMMPGMDGYELCQKLKTDLRTSHIPVLLLTAKASLDSRLEGLERGADDYLPKPFHVAELRLRIRNQLAQQQRLRQQLRTELGQSAEDPAEQAETETSDLFLRRLYALLDEHLDDPELNVEHLLEPMGMSRSTLQRKLKVLTDLSPAEVIRLYRLKQAAKYLRQGMSVAETAYQVGFKTPSHFSRMFRAQYQIAPAKFAREAKKN